MWFDSNFSFSKHVQKVCKGCFCQLRDFRSVRQFLTHDAAVSVANALVSSRLDYCNSLFRSLPKASVRRLQSIQNCAARIVTNSCRYTHITPILRKLHWLPVQFCSEFKLAALVNNLGNRRTEEQTWKSPIITKIASEMPSPHTLCEHQ